MVGHGFVGFDSGQLGVADQWLRWFVCFNGGGLWVMGFGRWVLILILRLMSFDFDYDFLG